MLPQVWPALWVQIKNSWGNGRTKKGWEKQTRPGPYVWSLSVCFYSSEPEGEEGLLLRARTGRGHGKAECWCLRRSLASPLLSS